MYITIVGNAVASISCIICPPAVHVKVSIWPGVSKYVKCECQTLILSISAPFGPKLCLRGNEYYPCCVSDIGYPISIFAAKGTANCQLKTVATLGQINIANSIL